MYLFFESLSTAPRKPQIGKLAAKHNYISRTYYDKSLNFSQC